MPTISSVAYNTSGNLLPIHEGGIPTHFVRDFTFSSTIADNGDDVTLLTLPAGYRIVDATLRVSGTLGASCTAQLRLGTTALTAATTAGGASTVKMNAFPQDTDGTKTVNVLIGGADVAAGATVQLHLEYVRI